MKEVQYTETLPDDFDWKFYLELYEDLRRSGFRTEEDAIRHYLTYGIKEKRVYKRVAIPVDFDWLGYILFNPYLLIYDHITENKTIQYYTEYGYKENFLYRVEDNQDKAETVELSLSNSTCFSEFINLTEIIYETNMFEKISEENYPKSISFNQLDYLSDEEGNVLVDFIGKFENLQLDYAHIMKQLNIPSASLQHLNKFEHKDYRSYYSDADIEKVYNLYKRDIEYFHYQF